MDSQHSFTQHVGLGQSVETLAKWARVDAYRLIEAPPHLAGQRIEVRFDPLDLTQVEVYHAGNPQGPARLVDAVVNGRTYR